MKITSLLGLSTQTLVIWFLFCLPAPATRHVGRGGRQKINQGNDKVASSLYCPSREIHSPTVQN